MPWPLSQDYNEAIQSPDSSFADPELRGGHAVTNALGMPMPRSGNFADVYEFIGASGAKWAIKCEEPHESQMVLHACGQGAWCVFRAANAGPDLAQGARSHGPGLAAGPRPQRRGSRCRGV